MEKKWLKRWLCLASIVLICSLSAQSGVSEQLSSIRKGGLRLQNLVKGKDVAEGENRYTGGKLPIYLVLEQYGADKLYEEVRHLPKAERREQTVNTLKEFSGETQKDLRVLLEDLEEKGKVAELRFRWIANIIGMKADLDVIEMFDNHPDVQMIEYDPLQYLLIRDFSKDEDELENTVRSDKNETNSRRNELQRKSILEPGFRNPAANVAHHNAPAVWEQGYKGQGIIVAVIDTGVNYNHHDLREWMWQHEDYPFHGWNTNANNNQTMDDNSHGTHCAGTVAGDGTAGTNTGMAPEATIMAIKCLSASGNGQEEMYWAAVEFAVEHGADVISVSLGWIYRNNPNRSMFREVMTNCLNAGVVGSIAAGNEGVAGLRTPGDCPPPWLHPDQPHRGGLSATVTVGATNVNDQIANFSSQGPVSWETIDPYNDYPLNPGTGLLKPDVCAVGVDVLSCSHNNNTAYTVKSGTSMATPGIAGIMALLLSKNPYASPEDICKALEETARPMSDTKSNIFGSGIVNPVDAIDAISFIMLHEVTYSDDNNNIPEYNETVLLNVSLINHGVGEADNIIANLSTDDEYIQIIRDSAEFGEIEPDSIVTINEAFLIEIADNAPDGHQVSFTIKVIASEDVSWSSHFTMDINAPKLTNLSPYIFDFEPDGNNNGAIDPGENVLIYFPIKNVGHSTSPPINLTVVSESASATIIEPPLQSYVSLSIDETIYPSLRVAVSNNVEYQEMLSFTYTLESGEYIFEGLFSVIVGGRLAVFLGEGEMTNDPSEPSPINIYFRSLRTQTVYTVEELNDAGMYGSIPITQIGYYVVSPPTQVLPNFSIKMKHTDAVNVIEHDDGPFREVFHTQTYRPSAGHWDAITLREPFLWNGTDNILIDTSFHPTEHWHASGQIKIYEVEDGFRFGRADTPSQHDVPTRDRSNDKPQLLMVFDSAAGDLEAPTNLTAQLTGLSIQLNWDPPQDQRYKTDGKSKRRNDISRSQRQFDRNPDGYFIYRNGTKLNEEPIEETEYFDEDYEREVRYYYYVTALYDEKESGPSNIARLEFIAAKPIFTPSDSLQYKNFQLLMRCTTPDAEIFYTLDGNEPDKESIPYQGPVEIRSDITVKAKAYRENWLESETTSINYLILRPPTELTAIGKPNSVYLTWKPPTGDSREDIRRSRKEQERSQDNNRNLLGYNVYRKSSTNRFIRINRNFIKRLYYLDEEIPKAGELTYYVTAVYSSGESANSNEVEGLCFVDKPSFSHQSGDYTEPFDLTIAVSTPGAKIYYTIDESEPTEESFLFEESLHIETTTTIKAVAMLSGWQDSEVAEGLFGFSATINEDEMNIAYITELFNAYPNPFNPETVIQFTLKEPDFVSIDIYNINGQRIKSLLNGQIEAGKHKCIWNGTDEKGNQISSGIYFYRMVTSDYKETKKVLMLK